ncbi:MAG TPA: bifunctional diaminohydroxyphosphoribosylaminopyrimidine deaminase/5-amino-6-(5-phosphoribosylamino)uracil reductase RibD [Dinghuibacter sp.]|uniref:bifunctional diaminohydroxyphosphoribosylaminopyrimidine deaminase/5-amino-6-(5-phosphoribosylamino)uracil reductase RibD n=1 Tax=Dinghuibacter sp. TaxID=2024697 RepID=UPI002C55AC43|nr:bifunctional diaminohydroxyphosphoribosylaminopyrimidine deaminase/5-amino-6-(5-phosphoribosylamino)uracil reductase RibD [Dinghuibacter sp.]HTJ12743.1 bifunctional diaminohydroxyphosphoribosylaminopyrimidine deaminase/5-amino-6-(5-phosphoribosylamino)uracil reductase RibD [Dinghuibacter sp.]
MMVHEKYMRRCLELAELGAGSVAPNPMVGAVLVYGDAIIGEGYHKKYGQAHAEPNCIRDAEERFAQGATHGFATAAALLGASTLYVSLEPCAHHGKTPPCADLVVSKGIPKVVVGVRDPFPQVNGKGIDKLEKAGVTVIQPVLEQECAALNRRFFTYHIQRRPYIVLKWAESADSAIGRVGERVPVSNGWSNRLVHRWRSEEAAILVGGHTALVDDPSLTNRLWPGASPTRVVLGRDLPGGLRIFDNAAPTLVYETRVLAEVLEDLHRRSIQSVLVEGGARLLNAFIAEGLWDEIRLIRSSTVNLPGGIPAPVLPRAKLDWNMRLGEDDIYGYVQYH